MENLLNRFRVSSQRLIKWCDYNRIDINWLKTKAMFITNKRSIDLPISININNNIIEVVIIIDNKLNFLEHIGKLKNTVNKRLYAIKDLFYLQLKVKIQFLKTFIMPYFDYCTSILIYMPKVAIQKLANAYNSCIFKLLQTKRLRDIKINYSHDFNQLNNALEYYGLQAFQHRIIIRVSTYIHKLYNSANAPANLVKNFIFNRDSGKNYSLRNSNKLIVPGIGKYNDYAVDTFSYFFSKLINELLINDLLISEVLFRLRLKNNINRLFLIFISTFSKFDINFKTIYIPVDLI